MGLRYISQVMGLCLTIQWLNTAGAVWTKNVCETVQETEIAEEELYYRKRNKKYSLNLRKRLKWELYNFVLVNIPVKWPTYSLFARRYRGESFFFFAIISWGKLWVLKPFSTPRNLVLNASWQPQRLKDLWQINFHNIFK